eukprot:scaffold3505_cov385-Prasinococcus_capsulatus_cf.AAC.8
MLEPKRDNLGQPTTPFAWKGHIPDGIAWLTVEGCQEGLWTAPDGSHRLDHSQAKSVRQIQALS